MRRIIGSFAGVILLCGVWGGAISPLQAQVGKLAFKKLPLTGYSDRNTIHDWVATKSTLSILITSDVLDRTIADEQVLIGTHKLKPAGGISAFKGQMEVMGYPLVRAAWPDGGSKGLVFMAAEAPLSPTYLFELEVSVANLSAKGRMAARRVIYRVPYLSGGLHHIRDLVAAHSGDRAAAVFTYYRIIAGSFQSAATWFVEVDAAGNPIGSPMEIRYPGAGSTSSLTPLSVVRYGDTWIVALRFLPNDTASATTGTYEQLVTCAIPVGGVSPAVVNTMVFENSRSELWVLYSGASLIPEFGKSRTPAALFMRRYGVEDATARKLPRERTLLMGGSMSAEGFPTATAKEISVPRWEKEEYIYSRPGPNSLVNIIDSFTNVVRGSGYQYLVGQLRHGTHSTWPDGGSENDPEQQYNLYQIDARSGAATRLAKADFKWKSYEDSRNLTRFTFSKIIRLTGRTGFLIHSKFGPGEELLYALY